MAGYKLSPRAEARLLEIEADSALKFGEYQADAYIAGFQQSFELIARFPLIGRSADELRKGYRRYRYQAQHIFYTLEVDHVLIRAILHAARDLRPELFYRPRSVRIINRGTGTRAPNSEPPGGALALRLPLSVLGAFLRPRLTTTLSELM